MPPLSPVPTKPQVDAKHTQIDKDKDEKIKNTNNTIDQELHDALKKFSD